MKYSLKLCVLLCGIILMPHQARSQPDQKIAGKESLAKQAALLDPLLKGATALNPQKTLYLDSNTKSVWLRAHVVLQEGILEMLCCPDQTKEHESILATNCSGQAIHTALLAIGAEPGSPVEFTPEFTPPRGEELAITLHWAEPNGKLKKEEATEWIRTTTRRYFIARLPELPKDLVIPEDYELRYDAQNGELLHFGELTPAYLEQYQKLSSQQDYRKALLQLQKISQPSKLNAKWIFAGSMLREDPRTKQMIYLADGGDLICVANFSSALIDVAIQSSSSDDSRGYEANPEKVPPMGTPVLIQLQKMKDAKQASPSAPVAQ